MILYIITFICGMVVGAILLAAYLVIAVVNDDL